MKHAIIDCRNYDQFFASHHRDACHIPADELFQRMHELPEKGREILLIIDGETEQPAKAFFSEKAYPISQTQRWTTSYEQELAEQGLLAKGRSSMRYWRPSNLVQQFCSEQLQQLADNAQALDIAAGAGRDSVYLALHGINVTALDVNPDAIARTKRLAEVNQVSVATKCIDLESNNAPLAQFSDNSFDFIVVCRYLHRPLFCDIKRLIKPGGFLLYHTFMQGSEKFGSPRNPNYLLKDNELAEVFNNFNIIKNEIEYLQDGRPTSFFIAQKCSVKA
jgi:SAM-dependent methyltransferase